MSRKVVLLALKALLSPVAQFCVRHGLKVQDLENVFKVTVLETARRQLLSDSIEPNTSRLSAVTGIPRKFIPKYLSDEAFEESQGDILTRVIGQWQSDTRFLDSREKPRVLNTEGSESDFAELVKSISADLNTYTVLNELIRLGHIEKKGTNAHLKSRIHLLKKLPEAMSLVSLDTLALQNAAEENVSLKEPKHLHLTTRYDNIPESSLPEIEAWLIKEGSLFHRKARKFLSKYDRDLHPGKKQHEKRHRVYLGAFSFTDLFSKITNIKKGKS